jgi:catalase
MGEGAGKFHKLALLSLLCCSLSACDRRADALQLGETREAPGEPAVAARLVEAIKQASLGHYPQGEIKRFNQGKGLGCFAAEFAVASNLPTELQQGLFRSGQVYPARIRFASASETDDSKKDFRGMAIKVSNVAGKSLWGDDGVQDFLLNSYPALFAGTPEDFLSFAEAVRDDATWKYFINPRHFYSLLIVLKGRARIASPFDIRFWSTTPYRFGDSRSVAVKYFVKPCSKTTSEMPAEPGNDYLSAAMKRHLQKAEACFDFMVQFQTDPKAMPVEDASVAWDERASPYRKVATITIKDQEFQSESARQQCERMTFNPWQSLAAHEPIGGINRARKPVYSELGRFRGEENRRRGIAGWSTQATDK